MVAKFRETPPFNKHKLTHLYRDAIEKLTNKLARSAKSKSIIFYSWEESITQDIDKALKCLPNTFKSSHLLDKPEVCKYTPCLWWHIMPAIPCCCETPAGNPLCVGAPPSGSTLLLWHLLQATPGMLRHLRPSTPGLLWHLLPATHCLLWHLQATPCLLQHLSVTSCLLWHILLPTPYLLWYLLSATPCLFWHLIWATPCLLWYPLLATPCLISIINQLHYPASHSHGHNHPHLIPLGWLCPIQHYTSSSPINCDFSKFMIKKDIWLTRLRAFGDRVETYLSWKNGFRGVMDELSSHSFRGTWFAH